tara:strand:- start:1179 stop:1388 length:210 start_codon:yes stop_codon:yes gene_type:complete
MGMSSWILDQEEEFWDKVDEFVLEAESYQEAVGNSIKFAKDKWLVPHLDENQIEDGVYVSWQEAWGDAA